MTGVFTSHPTSHLRTTTAFGRHGGGARHPASAPTTEPARAQVPLRALALAANDVLPDVAELLDAHGLEEVVHGAVDDTAEDHVGGAVRGHH